MGQNQFVVVRVASVCSIAFLQGVGLVLVFAFFHRALAIARHGCGVQQRSTLQLACPKCTHLVKVSCITRHPDDRVIQHAGRSQVTRAVGVKVNVTLPMDP